MNTRTTTCRPLHAVPSLHCTPFARRHRPQRSFLGFGISGFGIFLGFGILGFGISGALPAQLAPITTGTTPLANVTPITTATTTAAATDDEIVQMSVFNVNSSADRGYQAMNTASGSRINTPLKDTAASISPFTQEFLQDIGATTIDDMLSYGANIETDTGDADYGFNTDIGGAATTDNGFRIRGLSMTTAMDGVETTFSQDTYNIDRAEISSGPNSILFGMGQPGGMVTLASKRANLQRNTTNISNVIGTWYNPGEAWNYYRATLDHNIVLMPRIMALRINALYQDGGTGVNGSWRYWQPSYNKRINPALTFKPWKNTTITAAYEAGRTKTPVSYAWNASDRISGWLNAGSPILEVFNSTPTTLAGRLPGTQQIGNNNAFATGAQPYYVYVDNGAPALYDYRQCLQSMNGIFANAAKTNDMQQLRAPASMSSYNYSTTGPGGWREQRFDRYQFVIEQRIGNLNLQAGYYHTKNNAIAHAPSAFDAALRGDPNRYISSPDYANTGPGTIRNPNAAGLYFEDNWEMRRNTNRSDVYRLTGEYSINLQKFGRHRLIGMYEHTDSEIYNTRLAELLIDETNHAIATPTDLFPSTNNGIGNAPNGNLLIRRHYVTPGDFSTYYVSDWGIPIQPFLLNGHMYHSQYVTRENNNVNDTIHSQRTIDSYTLTLQSYWFNDRLVTIFGGRFDDTFSRRIQLRYRDNGLWVVNRVTDPNDPRILDGSKILNEAVLDGPWLNRPHSHPYTYSYGAVWHATDRLSAYGNVSTNRNSDDPYGRTVLPYGNEPSPSVGISTDYGVMFDPLGNNRLFLRLGHFNTEQRNQLGAANQPNLKSVADRLGNVYTALHSAGLLLDDNAPPFTAGMTDAYSRGYEGEITANFTRNFTMRLTFSYTDRARENVFKEIFDYFNAKIPLWMNAADPARNGNVQYYYSGATLYQYLLDQLYTLGSAEVAVNGAAGSSIRDDLCTVLTMQSGGMGSRPLKVNLTARYAFQQNWLKGFAVVGSMRYNSPNRMPDPARDWLSSQDVTPDAHPTTLAMDPATFTDYATMIKGNTLLFWDAMLSYRCKIFGGRANMTLQLNLKNIFNQSLVTPGQYRKAFDGTIYLRRIYLNEPRSIRLTANFDF